MYCKRKLKGLVFFFIGVGMVIQFIMPVLGMIIAPVLIILGFWFVFFAR